EPEALLLGRDRRRDRRERGERARLGPGISLRVPASDLERLLEHRASAREVVPPVRHPSRLEERASERPRVAELPRGIERLVEQSRGALAISLHGERDVGEEPARVRADADVLSTE